MLLPLGIVNAGHFFPIGQQHVDRLRDRLVSALAYSQNSTIPRFNDSTKKIKISPFSTLHSPLSLVRFQPVLPNTAIGNKGHLQLYSLAHFAANNLFYLIHLVGINVKIQLVVHLQYHLRA